MTRPPWRPLREGDFVGVACLGKPVLAGWPAGYGRPNPPLPLGLSVTIDAAAGALRLEEDLLA